MGADDQAMETRAVRIPLPGLGCGEARLVERDLSALSGVVRAFVNPATETAFVDYQPDKTDLALLVRALQRAGFRTGPPAE
jgi:P-type Cu2+ transporter